MNAENEFEKWWADTSYGETVPLTDWQLHDICFAAFALGKQSGIDSVNSLPHRAMFDAGVAYGRREAQEATP